MQSRLSVAADAALKRLDEIQYCQDKDCPEYSKPLVGGLCIIVSNDPTEVEYAEAERAHEDEKIIGEMNWGAIRALRQTADAMDRQPRFITTVEEAIEFVRGVANNLEKGI